MFSQHLTKPDGRALTLYARRPFAPVAAAPSPVREPHRPNAHLRWHPLREEWVAYAGHRQHRTFLPPKEFNPLAPDRRPGAAHRAARPATTTSRSSTTSSPPSRPSRTIRRTSIVDTRPALGACEVVVFSRDAQGSLGGLPLVAHRAAARGLGRSHARRRRPRRGAVRLSLREPRRRSRRHARSTRTGRSTPIRSCRRFRRASSRRSALLRGAWTRPARGSDRARNRGRSTHRLWRRRRRRPGAGLRPLRL